LKQGYAVEVTLFKWYKRSEDPADFQKVRSQYVSSFTKQQAENVYNMLSSSLRNQIDVHGKPPSPPKNVTFGEEPSRPPNRDRATKW